MKRNIKLFTGFTLSLLSLASILTVCNGGSFTDVKATLNDVGNHYTTLAPTVESSGTKEYWVSCVNHMIYFQKPSNGTWSEAGTAGAVDPSDERYIPSIQSVIDEGNTEEAEKAFSDYYGLQVDIRDEGNEIILTGVNKGQKDIVLPEGVTGIECWNNDPFDGTNPSSAAFNILSITIPSTCQLDGTYTTFIKNCRKLQKVTFNCSYIPYNTIVNCKELNTINISNNVTTVSYGAFVDLGNKKCVINCEATSKPAGWDNQWNITNDYSSRYTTNWNVDF